MGLVVFRVDYSGSASVFQNLHECLKVESNCCLLRRAKVGAYGPEHDSSCCDVSWCGTRVIFPKDSGSRRCSESTVALDISKLAD